MHFDVVTPSKLDAAQEQLLRDLAQLRGEENPEITVTNAESTEQGNGFFSRIRDAFK